MPGQVSSDPEQSDVAAAAAKPKPRKRKTSEDDCVVSVGPCGFCGWQGKPHPYSLGDYRSSVEARAAAERERSEHRCEGIIAADAEASQDAGSE